MMVIPPTASEFFMLNVKHSLYEVLLFNDYVL